MAIIFQYSLTKSSYQLESRENTYIHVDPNYQGKRMITLQIFPIIKFQSNSRSSNASLGYVTRFIEFRNLKTRFL